MGWQLLPDSRSIAQRKTPRPATHPSNPGTFLLHHSLPDMGISVSCIYARVRASCWLLVDPEGALPVPNPAPPKTGRGCDSCRQFLCGSKLVFF